MYRFRGREQVLYGHFREYLQIANEWKELARERGWAEVTLWVPTAGTANEVIWEADYPDLATMEREQQAHYTDAEAMKLARRFAEHLVQGSTQSELLEHAPEQIA